MFRLLYRFASCCPNASIATAAEFGNVIARSDMRAPIPPILNFRPDFTCIIGIVRKILLPFDLFHQARPEILQSFKPGFYRSFHVVFFARHFPRFLLSYGIFELYLCHKKMNPEPTIWSTILAIIISLIVFVGFIFFLCLLNYLIERGRRGSKGIFTPFVPPS